MAISNFEWMPSGLDAFSARRWAKASGLPIPDLPLRKSVGAGCPPWMLPPKRTPDQPSSYKSALVRSQLSAPYRTPSDWQSWGFWAEMRLVAECHSFTECGQSHVACRRRISSLLGIRAARPAGDVMSCDIKLDVGAGSAGGQFTARVGDAPSGSGPSTIFQLDVDGLLRERDALETTVLASAVAGRRIIPAHEQRLRRVGQHLFEALFSGSVLGTYRASFAIAQERGEPLRVVLGLTAPPLAALPWEALFDPEIEAYICRKEPLVRHVPAPYTRDPLKVTPPLRVLGLVASPRGCPPSTSPPNNSTYRRRLLPRSAKV